MRYATGLLFLTAVGALIADLISDLLRPVFLVARRNQLNTEHTRLRHPCVCSRSTARVAPMAGRRSFDDTKAEFPERFGGEGAHARFVFGHEHGMRTRWGAKARLRPPTIAHPK